MEIYADMVKIHYEYYKNKRKQRSSSYKKHIPSNLKEIEKYTDIDSMVFENKDNNELVVAMRGLDLLKSPRDQLIGAEIFLEDAYQQSGSDFDTSTAKKKGISLLPNKYGEILRKEQSKIEELKKEYPNKKMVLAGHSRGGRKAIDLGEKNKLEYHAFQPAEMNRMANPILAWGTNLLAPMGAPLYGNIDKSLWDMYNPKIPPGESIVNEMINEFMDLKEIQKNLISAATSSSDYQTAVKTYLGKTLIPRIIERSIDLKEGYDPMRFGMSYDGRLRPEILKREMIKAFGRRSIRLDDNFPLPDESFIKENMDSVLTLLATKSKEKRKAPNGDISHVYRTANDRVSMGYEHTQLVQPKHYAYGIFDHYFLGDHSIDHFISKEMFNSVKEDEPIEEPIFSPQSTTEPSSQQEITPAPYEHKEADTRSLCRKYPNYSPQCKFILR